MCALRLGGVSYRVRRKLDTIVQSKTTWHNFAKLENLAASTLEFVDYYNGSYS